MIDQTLLAFLIVAALSFGAAGWTARGLVMRRGSGQN